MNGDSDITKTTLGDTWLVVGAFGALLVGGLVLDMKALDQHGRSGFDLPITLVAAFGHIVWLSMDRKRLGLDFGSGIWRFFTFILGPIAICVYLAVFYRRRAILLIPLYFLILISIVGLAVLIVYLTTPS